MELVTTGSKECSRRDKHHEMRAIAKPLSCTPETSITLGVN